MPLPERLTLIHPVDQKPHCRRHFHPCSTFSLSAHPECLYLPSPNLLYQQSSSASASLAAPWSSPCSGSPCFPTVDGWWQVPSTRNDSEDGAFWSRESVAASASWVYGGRELEYWGMMHRLESHLAKRDGEMLRTEIEKCCEPRDGYAILERLVSKAEDVQDYRN